MSEVGSDRNGKDFLQMDKRNAEGPLSSLYVPILLYLVICMYIPERKVCGVGDPEAG